MANKTDHKKWYVLHAVSGKENKLKEYIEAQKNHNPLLEQAVGEVFLPMEHIVKNTPAGKRSDRLKTAMPGYLFVEADLSLGEVASTLRFMPNCLGFLGGMDHPTPVPQREVDRMKGAAEASELTSTVDIPFEVDEVVKVIDGPFNGFSGVIEKVDREKRKLTLGVNIFDRRTSLELSYEQVQREG